MKGRRYENLGSRWPTEHQITMSSFYAVEQLGKEVKMIQRQKAKDARRAEQAKIELLRKKMQIQGYSIPHIIMGETLKGQNVAPEIFLSPKRTAKLVKLRARFVHKMFELDGWDNYSRIGKFLKRDHSSVRHLHLTRTKEGAAV